MGSRIGPWILGIVCLLVVAATAGAVAPEDVTYQGRLLDSVGDPLVGPVAIASSGESAGDLESSLPRETSR